jgi:hypothetical protein
MVIIFINIKLQKKLIMNFIKIFYSVFVYEKLKEKVQTDLYFN